MWYIAIISRKKWSFNQNITDETNVLLPLLKAGCHLGSRVAQRSKALHLSARAVTTDTLVQIQAVSQPAVIGSHICQSRRKQVFFQDNLVRGLIHASFTKTHLPDSNLAEAPPDHRRSSTKFHSGCETLTLKVSHPL